MATRKGKRAQEERKLTRSKMLVVAFSLILVLIITAVFAMVFFSHESPKAVFSLNATIIDQLNMEYPNMAFVENVTNILKSRNFNVTYYNQKLDVEFFKKLATYNYGIIILRIHSALRNDRSTVDLFTSELFKENLHVKEQSSGLVVEGILNYSSVPKEYFAITYKFIENLEGIFPKSVIIAMGCWSLNRTQMAEAFIKKGAIAYIGWSGLVEHQHTDKETLKLIQKLVKDNVTINEAVNGAAHDLIWGSKMNYYPIAARDIKISSLIEETLNKPAFNQIPKYLGCIMCYELKPFSLRISKHVC